MYEIVLKQNSINWIISYTLCQLKCKSNIQKTFNHKYKHWFQRVFNGNNFNPLNPFKLLTPLLSIKRTLTLYLCLVLLLTSIRPVLTGIVKCLIIVS